MTSTSHPLATAPRRREVLWQYGVTENFGGRGGFLRSREDLEIKALKVAATRSGRQPAPLMRLIWLRCPALMTATFGDNFTTHPLYVFLSKSAHLLLESSWILFLSNATAEKRDNQIARCDPPINVSDTHLSPHAEAVLSRCPKFAASLAPSRVDQLAAVHQIASRIPEPLRQEFLRTGSSVICRHGVTPPSEPDFPEVVEELKRSELKLVEADKTGVFVVMNSGDFSKKIEAVLNRNFKTLKNRPSGSLRTEVKNLCKANELSSLLTKISKPSDQYLHVFFTAKTHKPDIPFRSIVSEDGCCQKHLDLFLQKHLTEVPLEQPFRVSSSLEVLPTLQELHSSGSHITMFSLDVTDMYFSLDVEVLMDCVEQAVTQFGLVKFQNSTGIPLDAFLQLIRLYLRSTLIEHKGKIFTQKSGVCIGSRLAPFLSEMYMSAMDVAVKRELSVATPGTKIFRYVDDYLLLHDRNVSPASIEQVFSRHSRGLNFTKEEPAAEGLQFLDLRLQATPSGLCWSFQRSQKLVLPFASHHSENVKSGIVKFSLLPAQNLALTIPMPA